MAPPLLRLGRPGNGDLPMVYFVKYNNSPIVLRDLNYSLCYDVLPNT
jgi:hypothetical protein